MCYKNVMCVHTSFVCAILYVFIVSSYIIYIYIYIYRLNLKTEGSTEFITRRPWVLAPERSEGATKGLRVINYVDHVGFEV